MCGYVVARVFFFRMSIIPRRISQPQGGFHFFNRRGSNFLRMWIIHTEKGDTWEDLQGTCEETDSGVESQI